MEENTLSSPLTGIIILAPVSQSAEISKKAANLMREGGMTFERFLYPYADTLTLSEKGANVFGTHMLLDANNIGLVERCLREACGDVPYQLRAVGCTVPKIEAFLKKKRTKERGAVSVGSLADLLPCDVRPWQVRECAKKLCSFSEHISRIDGVNTAGSSGGRIILSGMKKKQAKSLSDIYFGKTGKKMKIK